MRQSALAGASWSKHWWCSLLKDNVDFVAFSVGSWGRSDCIWRLRCEAHRAIPCQGPGGRKLPTGRRQGIYWVTPLSTFAWDLNEDGSKGWLNVNSSFLKGCCILKMWIQPLQTLLKRWAISLLLYPTNAANITHLLQLCLQWRFRFSSYLKRCCVYLVFPHVCDTLIRLSFRWSFPSMKWSELASRAQSPSGSSTAMPPMPRDCMDLLPHWRTTLASLRPQIMTRRFSFTTGRGLSSKLSLDELVIDLLMASRNLLIHMQVSLYLFSPQWNVWRLGELGAGRHSGVHSL